MGRSFSDDDFVPEAIPMKEPAADAPRAPRSFSDEDLGISPLDSAAQSIKDKPTMSRVGAAALGAVGGVTSDFDDEAIGTLGAAHAVANAPARWAAKGLRALGVESEGIDKLADQPGVIDAYRGNRDALRGLHHEAQEAHPGYHMGGEVAGGIAQSFLPGVGALGKGATVGKTALRAAGLGAIGGLGASEATDAKGLAIDAGIGGATAGALSGAIGKVTQGATGRVVKRALGDLTDGAPASMRDRLAGRAGSKLDDVYAMVRETPGLAKAGGDSQKALAAVEAGIEKTGAKIDSIFAKAGAATPGIRPTDVVGKIDVIAKELEANPGTRAAARAVRAQIDDVMASWGEREHVSPQEVREFAKAVGDTAFAGSPAMGYKQGKAIAQDVWGGMKDLIEDSMHAAAKNNPDVSVTQLKELNKRMSTLLGARQAVAYKATREATGSTRLVSRVQDGLKGAAAMMAASGNIAPLAAMGAYKYAAKPLGRAADNALASYVQLVKAGGKPGELLRRGVELGIPADVARRVVDGFSPNSTEE